MMKPLNKFTAIVLLVFIVALMVQCKDSAHTATTGMVLPIFTAEDASKGEAVAVQYCHSCHEVPTPSLLDKTTWAYKVLPVMGQYLGIPAPPKYHVPQVEKNYVPVRPVMSPLEWKRINAYFITKSPEHMPALNRAEPIHRLPFFDIQPAPAQWVSTQAFTSCVKIDTSVVPHRLIVCDGLTNRLIVLNDKGQTLNSAVLNSAIVNLSVQKNAILATAIGSNLEPNDLKAGSVTAITINSKGVLTPQAESLFTGLNRPLSVDMTDIDQDGKPDYLVAQFGKMGGSLSWFESKKGHAEHIIRNKPGCMKAIIDKHGKNNRPDIWALFAQGDEGIFHYVNKGKGIFEERRVLSFPPSYGSISFEMVDFNGDGYKDIIYACGDNADFSRILKPYHGVYIYLNDGKDNFSRKYFYPIHGCNKAIAKDFDGDGDLDIATVSEYPGIKTPWEAFIYLENKGSFKFQAYTMPLNTPFTRGMTMDAADIDGDGKPDLLLGAGFAAEDVNGNDKQPLFVVLKNKSHTRAKTKALLAVLR